VNLSIELPDDLGAAVKEQAQAQGISPGRYVSRVLENTLGSARAEAQSGTFETGYGMWAKRPRAIRRGDRREPPRHVSELCERVVNDCWRR